MDYQEVMEYVARLNSLKVIVDNRAKNLLANVTVSTNTRNFNPMFVCGQELGFSRFHSREEIILAAELKKSAKLCPLDLPGCLPLWDSLPENGHTILAMEPQLVCNGLHGIFSFKKTGGQKIISVEFAYPEARWCHAHPWTFQGEEEPSLV